jgi:hypothetical protein
MEPRLFRPVTLRRHLSMALPLTEIVRRLCPRRARAHVMRFSDRVKNVTHVALFVACIQLNTRGPPTRIQRPGVMSPLLRASPASTVMFSRPPEVSANQNLKAETRVPEPLPRMPGMNDNPPPTPITRWGAVARILGEILKALERCRAWVLRQVQYLQLAPQKRRRYSIEKNATKRISAPERAVMKRLMDVAALAGEFTRYLLVFPTDDRGRRLAFGEALLDQIAQGRVRPRARPFMLGYTLISALDDRRYSTAFQVLKQYGHEAPWQQMSERLLRRRADLNKAFKFVQDVTRNLQVPGLNPQPVAARTGPGILCGFIERFRLLRNLSRQSGEPR